MAKQDIGKLCTEFRTSTAADGGERGGASSSAHNQCGKRAAEIHAQIVAPVSRRGAWRWLEQRRESGRCRNVFDGGIRHRSHWAKGPRPKFGGCWRGALKPGRRIAAISKQGARSPGADVGGTAEGGTNH